MRILGPIVLARPPLVASRQSDFGLCGAVRAKLVGPEHIGCEALFLEQLAHQFHGCSLVAPSLRQQVENLAFAVNRAPQLKLPPRDRHGHLVEMPLRRRAVGVDRAILERIEARTSRPAVALFRRTHRGHTQRAETRIEPHGVPDGWRAETGGGQTRSSSAISPAWNRALLVGVGSDEACVDRYLTAFSTVSAHSRRLVSTLSGIRGHDAIKGSRAGSAPFRGSGPRPFRQP